MDGDYWAEEQLFEGGDALLEISATTVTFTQMPMCKYKENCITNSKEVLADFVFAIFSSIFFLIFVFLYLCIYIFIV